MTVIDSVEYIIINLLIIYISLLVLLEMLMIVGLWRFDSYWGRTPGVLKQTAVDRLIQLSSIGLSQCQCQGLRHLFDFLQLMSSQRAMMMELSNCTLLFLMVEFFDRRQLVVAFLLLL